VSKWNISELVSWKYYSTVRREKERRTYGNILDLFSRAEDLLANQSIGCFLIRLSESRFGFSLSFRAEDRCRHYMINQLKNSKYNVIGESKVHQSLEHLIEYYRTVGNQY